MSTTKAIWTLLAVVVLIGLYIALAMVLGVRQQWAGMLLLTLWSLVDRGDPATLPRSAISIACGLFLATVPALASPFIGAPGALGLMLALILLAIFLFMTGRAAIAVNPVMLIALTVASIPQVSAQVPPLDLFIGLGFGVAYFGLVAAIGGAFARWRGENEAPRAT